MHFVFLAYCQFVTNDKGIKTYHIKRYILNMLCHNFPLKGQRPTFNFLVHRLFNLNRLDVLCTSKKVKCLSSRVSDMIIKNVHDAKYTMMKRFQADQTIPILQR